MKHKKFNETYPYTYYIKNKHTQKKYYGVRYGNIRLNITPEEDFAKEYFTSSKYVNLNEQNKSDWIIKLHYTFDSIEEAQEYEHKLLTKVYKRSDWLNKTNNKAIFNDNESTQKQIDNLKKTRKEKYWNNGLVAGDNHPLKNIKKSEEHKKNNPKCKISEEHKKAISIKNKGKRPHNATDYILLKDDEPIYYIPYGNDIKKFCKEKGLIYSALRTYKKVMKGVLKGWQLKKVRRIKWQS